MNVKLLYKRDLLYSVDSKFIVGRIRIGRDLECEWQIPSNIYSISRIHAEIVLEGGGLWLVDLDSKNGIQKKNKNISKFKIRPGDRFQIGKCKLICGPETKAPIFHVVVLSKTLGQRMFPLRDGVRCIIGSSPESSIRVSGNSKRGLYHDEIVSGRHAEVFFESGAWKLQDLGSTNSTFIQGRRIGENEKVKLSNGMLFFVGDKVLRFGNGAFRICAWKIMAVILWVLVLIDLYFCIKCGSSILWALNAAMVSISIVATWMLARFYLF